MQILNIIHSVGKSAVAAYSLTRWAATLVGLQRCLTGAHRGGANRLTPPPRPVANFRPFVSPVNFMTAHSGTNLDSDFDQLFQFQISDFSSDIEFNIEGRI